MQKLRLRNSRLLILGFTGIALFSQLSAFNAHAEENSAEEQRVTKTFKHKLDGHDFLPSFLLPSPFADSEAQIGIQFASGTLTSPTFLQGLQNLSLAAFSPVLAGQVAIGKRFAVNFGFAGTVVMGINATALTNYGASAQYNYLFGGLMEIIRDEKTVFSGAMDFQRPHTIVVSPAGLLPQAVQNVIGSGSPNYAANTVEAVYKPTLRVAHAFTPDFGVKAMAGAVFSSYAASDTTSAGAQALFGVSLEEDFHPMFHVALGITLNYLRNQVVVAGSDNADTFEFGLVETFRDAFNFGIELGKIERDALSATVGSIFLRAYYN